MRALLFALLAVGAASATLSSELESGCGSMRCIADTPNEGEISADNGKSPNDPVLRIKRHNPSEKVCKPGDQTKEKNGVTCFCTDDGTSWACAGMARQSEIFVLTILGSVFLSLLSSIYHR